ncbi:acyl-CoA N-acyltransferase [Phycomyces nitens]|nr:acyl-CoA N-acyltransferase [Phycomyces nitens]
MSPVPARTIYVRLATIADLKHNAKAHAVVNAAYRSTGGWTTEVDLVGGERETIEGLAQSVTDQGKPNTLLYAFETTESGSEEVVGTVQIQPISKAPGEAEVGLFSVDPQYQSKGIGGKLVRAALDTMKTMGFKVAVMKVIENRADLLQWYYKLGFVNTGERVPFVFPDLLKVKDLSFITLKKPLV